MVSLRLSLSRTRLLRNENDVVRRSEGGNEFSQQEKRITILRSRTRKVGSESFGEVGRRYSTFQNVEANVGRTHFWSEDHAIPATEEEFLDVKQSTGYEQVVRYYNWEPLTS